MKSQNITLYFRNDTSDKVYQASLQPQGQGYVVEFAFGRRGSTLQTGSKTQSPLEYDKAKKIYDKLVAEKMAKGYSPGAAGTPYVGTTKVDQVSGVQCQLLNPIDEQDLAHYIDSPDWCFQEKFDGRRMLIRRTPEGTLEGINRKGLVVALPSSIEQAVANITEPFIFDGEAIGDKLYLFDLLHYESNDNRVGDIRTWDYQARLDLLLSLETRLTSTAIETIPTIIRPSAKESFVKRMRRENKEGIVIKHLAAPYEAGRPASGGNQLKYKFTETASALVLKVNDKRSVTMGLINGAGKLVEAGNVTILPNFAIPAPNSIIEVRYLYAHQQSGKLYQPVYLGTRDDINATDCLTSQLKFKSTMDEEES